jgi:hypothetical protein
LLQFAPKDVMHCRGGVVQCVMCAMFTLCMYSCVAGSVDEVDVRVSHLHTSFLSLSLKYCLGHELLVLKLPMQEFWACKFVSLQNSYLLKNIEVFLMKISSKGLKS